MTTAEQIAAIKLGSNVTYVDNDGVEHGAIAKGIATVGWHAGFRAYIAALTLIYLDEIGQVRQINSAPLLTEAQDDEFMAKAAEFMVERDQHAQSGGANPLGAEDVIAAREAHLQRIAGQPFKIGWKFAEQVPVDTAAFDSAIQWRKYASQLEEIAISDGHKIVRIAGDEHMTEAPSVPLDAAGIGLASARWEGGVAPGSDMTKGWHAGPGVPEPSSADLDAVAAEEKAKEATAHLGATEGEAGSMAGEVIAADPTGALVDAVAAVGTAPSSAAPSTDEPAPQTEAAEQPAQ